jgi:peptidoglycan glycosyltransferase
MSPGAGQTLDVFSSAARRPMEETVFGGTPALALGFLLALASSVNARVAPAPGPAGGDADGDDPDGARPPAPADDADPLTCEGDGAPQAHSGWQGWLRRQADEALVCETDAAALPDRIRLETARREGDHYVADRESGEVAELTLDPRLQLATERLLRRPQIKYGASVMLSIPDGRVLALAGRSSEDAAVGAVELALRPWAPAASVFKLVSAAALIDEAGLTGGSRACYHGGLSEVRADNLIDNPRIDRCASLAYGIGKSQNAILAKMAIRYLSPLQLARTGRALGFGEPLAFDLPVEPSHLDVPESDPLEFARTAAGFWHSTLSPLHGALLAAAIADGGQMLTPHLVEPADDEPDEDGTAPASVSEPAPRQALSPAAAAAVAEMMAGVTRMGTAHAAFYDRHGRSRLPFAAAGKTGTLYGKADRDWVGYSWFVGFAPVDHPTVAFAVALGNKPGRRLRASDLARELLIEYAAGEKDAAAAEREAAASADPRPTATRPGAHRYAARTARRRVARHAVVMLPG